MRGADDAFTSDDRELLKDSIPGLLERHWPPHQAQSLAVRPAAVRGLYRLLAEQALCALGADPQRGERREILLVMAVLSRAACPPRCSKPRSSMERCRARALVLRGLQI